MSTYNFYYSAGRGGLSAENDLEKGVIDSKVVAAEQQRTKGDSNYFLGIADGQAVRPSQGVAQVDAPARDEDRRYFAIERAIRNGLVPNIEQFQILERGRERHSLSGGEMIWNAVKSFASATADAIVSTVSEGDILNPLIIGTSLVEGTAQGTAEYAIGINEMANNPTHPLNPLFSGKTLNERYDGFVQTLRVNNWYENTKNEGFIFNPTYQVPLLGEVRGFNKDLAHAAGHVLDATTFIPGAGAIMALPVKAPIALAAKGLAKFGINAGNATVFASNVARAGLVRPIKSVSGFTTKVADGIIDTTVNTASKALGIPLAHVGNGVISPVNMNIRAATRGGVVGLSALTLPYGGPIASAWLGSKVVSTVASAADEALEMVSKDAGSKVPANLTIAERLRYQSPDSGVRLLGVALDKSTPIAQYAKTIAQNSFQGSLYGGAYGYIFGGETGFYYGVGTGLAMGGTFGTLGATYNAMPTRAKGNKEILKHFHYMMEGQDMPNKRGIGRLLEYVHRENGEDAAYQVMGMMVANKRLQKASKQLILTEEDIQLLAQDDNYAKWRDQLLDPAFGGITFVKEPDGTTVQIVNADRAGTSAVSGEMFHTALMNGRYGLMFREEIRNAFVGTEDEGGTLFQLPIDERVAVLRKFAEAYLGDTDPTIKGNQEVLRADFESTIEMVARGEKPATLTKLFEEMTESYWNRFAENRGAVGLINDNSFIGNVFRGAFHSVKDMMATDIRAIGGDIQFTGKNGVDGFFLDANGKRIRIPALDRVMRKLVKEMKKDGDFGFPVLERAFSADPILQPREFKRTPDGALIKDKDGNAIPMTEEETQQKMDEDADGLFSDLAELDAKDRGVVFKPRKFKDESDGSALFSPSKRLTQAQREAAKKIKQAEKEVEAERKKLARAAKVTASDNIDMPWLDVSEVVREGVEEGEKFEFEISGKFTAREREIFERRFGIDTTRKLETLLGAVNAKGIDLNNVVMARYRTKGSQRKNFTKEGKDIGRGNDKGAPTESVRKFLPYKVYIGFERGKRTQYTNRQGRVKRKFAIKNARLYSEAVDMDARMNRIIHAIKHAKVDREGFSAKTVQALFGSIGELEHAVNRLMSNYSRGELALVGADFFGGGRDGAMKRDIVNAIIGAHPTVKMIREGKGFYNYPKPMQLRGGVDNTAGGLLDDDGSSGPLNEAYTIWTRLRVDRLTTIPKSLHGEGFYYDHDKSFDLAQAVYQPQRRGHSRDHEGNLLGESEKAWTIGSIINTPSGEPYRVYINNADEVVGGAMRGSVQDFGTHDSYAYLQADTKEYGNAKDLEEGYRMIAKGKKVVKVGEDAQFLFKPEAAMFNKIATAEQYRQAVDEVLKFNQDVSFSPQRRSPKSKPLDLAEFSYRAIQRIAKVGNPEAETPLAVLAEMGKGEFEQWLTSGTIGINSPRRGALGFNKNNTGAELSLRHMQVWDQMISKMHAINYHAELGIDHTTLDAAGNKIFERILRTKFKEYEISESKAGRPAPKFEEYLNKEYEFREQLRSASRDQILRFIASYEIGDKIDGLKIPDASWRRVHDAVMEASDIVQMDVVDKVNTTIALLLRDLRESGQGVLANKLNKALNRSMEGASARLKQNAETLLKDGTISVNWREAVNQADYSKVIRTDLTGHYIKEETLTEMDDTKDANVIISNLRKLGAIVTTVKIPRQADVQRLANGEITKAELRSLAQEVNLVFSKKDGVTKQEFAFRKATIAGDVVVEGTRSRTKNITGVTETLEPIGEVETTRTSRIASGKKAGFEVWVPFKETGKVTLNVGADEMIVGIDALSDASVLNAENINDMSKFDIPFLKKMTEMVTRTSTVYEVYRPHGRHFDWRGEVPDGTAIAALTIGTKNIETKGRLLRTLDAAKAAVIDDIVTNYSHAIHLKSHVSEVDKGTKNGILGMISSSTIYKFTNPNLFRVYNVGDFVLVTGRNEQGKMRSLRNMKPEDVFGTLQKKPERIQKKGDKLLKEGQSSEGIYSQSFTNYAEIFRFVKGRDGLPDSVERVVGNDGEQFRSEADVRNFINEASRASSGMLSKMQLASKIKSRFASITEQWNEMHTSRIVNVLVENPKLIRGIEAKMRVYTQPLIDITQRIRKIYSEEIKDQNVLASEQIAKLFSLKNEKGELLSQGVTMSDKFGARVRPPSETIYRKSRAAKIEKGMARESRIQSRNEDGTLMFDDNNNPVYEMTEQLLQNDSVADLRVYMEPVLQNQIYTLFKEIGFLEITGAPWRSASPQWVVELFDKVKNDDKFTVEFGFLDDDARSVLMDAYDDGRDVLKSSSVGMFGPQIDKSVANLNVTAEAFRQLNKQYDDMGSTLEQTNENDAYVKLEKRRDALAQQLDRALNRKKKGGNGNAKVKDMTEEELGDFLEHAEKVKAEYEAGRTKVDAERDILKDEVVEAEGEFTKTYQEYVPLEGEDKGWVTRSDMKRLKQIVDSDILGIPSNIVRLLGSKDVASLFNDKEFLRYLKGEVKVPKTFGPIEGIGGIKYEYGTDQSTRDVEVKSIKQAMDAMQDSELDKLSEITRYLEEVKGKIFSDVLRLEREIKMREYEVMRLDDPAQRFINLIPKLLNDPEAGNYYPAIANYFDAVVEASSVDNLLQTQKALDALFAAFKPIATARDAKPIADEASKLLQQVLIDSVGLTFRKSSAFKELFGDDSGKKTTFNFQQGATIKGLIDTHGIFSDQVRQWIDNNTFTERPTRRFKHNRSATEDVTASKDSTQGIYLNKKALEAIAQIDKLRDAYDAQLAKIDKADVALKTYLGQAMSTYNKKRITTDAESARLYEQQEAELAAYWDEDNKTGELWSMMNTIQQTQSENVAVVVGHRLRDFFTKINSEILNRRIDTEKRRDSYMAHFRRIKQLAGMVPPAIAKRFDMYAMYSGADAVALRKEFPRTHADFYIEAAIPEGSILYKYQGRAGRQGNETVGRRDISWQVMMKEQMFHEFRKAFGIGEVELFDKARGLLEYYSRYENREIEPENLRLIGRYFPEEANKLSGRVQPHVDNSKETAAVEAAIVKHDLHKMVLSEALLQVSSNQKRIKEILLLIHGKGRGESRFLELQRLAEGKRKSRLINAEDLDIEEMEAVTYTLGDIAPYKSTTGANIETLSAQELLEGPMFKEWAERWLSKKNAIGSAEETSLRSIFDTPQMQARWAAMPFREKMANITDVVSGIRRAATEATKNEREAAYVDAVAERVRQRTLGFFSPEETAARNERLEKQQLEKDSAERLIMLKELFRKLNVVDTSMRAFKGRTESFFKNRKEARDSILSTENWSTLHEIPNVGKSDSKSKTDTFFETPNKRYMAMRKPNGSISLIFNGYTETGKISVKAHHLGVYPDMDRAQVAIRFADDDLHRLRIITDYTVKNGEKPPETVTAIGSWVSEFLDKNVDLLSEAEMLVLKQQIARVGMFPESAMIQLSGTGSVRRFTIYPNSKIWDLLHSGGDYEKDKKGVWRKNGKKELEAEIRALEAQTESRVRDIRNGINSSVDDTSPPPKLDQSRNDPVSEAVDNLSAFDVKEEAPVFPTNSSDPVSVDWIRLRNRVGYELRRIQEHRKGKWVTYYRMFNPAAGMIAERSNEEDAVAEMYKDFINGSK